jgi:hypothetical protein
VRLHEAIGRLSASGGRNDVGSIVDKVFPNFSSEKFCITIAPETPSIGTRISPKQTKGSQNRRSRQILETEDPIVTCGTVNENERVPEATRGDTVTEGNVDMNDVEVKGLFTVNGPAPRSLRDRRKRAERHWKFTAIHPLAIETGLKDMLVVTESTAAKSTMELFRSPVGFSVGSIGTIARTNRGKSGTRMMNQPNDLILRERRE